MLRLATFPSVMKPSSRPSTASLLEPLESRIAPARVILVGVPDSVDPNNPNPDVNYTDPIDNLFVNTELSADLISQKVGGGAGGVADTFYLKLTTGDKLQIFTSNGPQDYLRVNSGNVIAFFVDKNLNNEVDAGEMTGIALGKNASIVLNGGIEGDIVANYNDATNDLDMTGLVSSKQNIKSVTIGGGDVGTFSASTLVRGGSIIAGGAIGAVNVQGRVGSVLTGTAATGKTFDFFPDATYANAIGTGLMGSGQGTVAFSIEAGVAGGNISNVIVDGVASKIQAGDGGFGAAGGSITNVRFSEFNFGAQVIAGKGGDADGTKIHAGAGGSVSKVYFAPDAVGDSSASDLINVIGGAGGVSTVGNGGKGGNVSDVYVSYRFVGSKLLASGTVLADNVHVEAGAGGAGKTGGLGGSIARVKVNSVAPNAIGTDEVVILAGTGGASSTTVDGGKAGAGGGVTDIYVREVAVGVGPSLVVRAGDGGLVTGDDRGAAGGSVVRADLLASSISVFAGNGSSGTLGGAGGSAQTISIAVGQNTFASNLTINAGSGGNATAGAAGAGGAIKTLRVESGDFATFFLNTGGAANGGSSTAGKGGAGGSVTDADIFEADFGIGTNGLFAARTGAGGNGTTAGGAGGNLTKAKFSGTGLNAAIALGQGGDVTGANAKGKGGAGGSVSTVDVQVAERVSGALASVSVAAGDGGDGAGVGGAGGVGGSITGLNAKGAGAALVSAGDGGNGTFGAAGAGGSVSVTGVFASGGDGELIAGNAGQVGGKAAKGGSISGTAGSLTGLYSFNNLTIQAGNGSHGGAGGSLKNIGYGSTSTTLQPTPSGNIVVQAGNGSVEGKTAGAGGSITNVSGAVSSGDNHSTLIFAGGGGSSEVNLLAARTTPGTGASAETQTLDLSTISYSQGGTFTLSFNNSAPSVQISATLTAGETPAARAALIQTALNALPTIQPNSVTVTPGAVENTYLVAFSVVGSQPQIGVAASVGKVASAGGSISNVVVERGGAENGTVRIQAGDGGSTLVGAGGAGGGLASISISNIGDDTILRSVAAGDGGNGGTKGGIGGSVNKLDVLNHDIGVRTGEVFGYNTMGGLYAGLGGSAPSQSGTVMAKSGSVTNVTANSIASIVAGRADTPGMAEKVENIYLNGNQALKDSDGAIFHTYPGARLILTFNGVDSAPINIGTPANDGSLVDNLPDDVEDILNAMSSVQTAGGVTVTGTFYGGYTIKFNSTADQPDFSARQVFGEATVETVHGSVPLSSQVDRVGDDEPALHEVHSFTFDPSASFVVTYAGSPTGALAPNSTALQVQNALNALSSIASVGGVTVTKDTINNRFVVTYNATADIPGVITAEAVRQEQQQLSLYRDAGMTYTLTFNGQTTSALPTPLDNSSTAQDVQDRLNALASVSAAGGVSVQDDGHGGFLVTFGDLGDQPSLVINQTKTFTVGTQTQGDGATTQEVQVAQVPDRVTFNLPYLQTANFVGGIANPLTANPNLFHADGGVVSTFQLGDKPVDGLIMAKIFVAAKTNFIPEALLTGQGTAAEFQEFNNLI